MAVSDVTIANRALRRLGQAPITALDGATPDSARVLALYPETRDTLLVEVKPRFAQARASLAEDATAPAFGWSHRYPVPADYLAVLGLGEDEAAPDEPYVEEGGAILTDATAPLALRYIKRVTDPTAFSPGFVDLFAVTLAAELAYPITQSTTREQALREEAATKLALLRFTEGVRGTPPARGDEGALTRVRRS